MTGAGINDGDLVLVRRSETVEFGQIAVVCVDGEMTIKKVVVTSEGIVLQAANPAVPSTLVQRCIVGKC